MIERLPGEGWLVLIGGGEFSFGDTEAVDHEWLERTPDGPIAFVPTASGSVDYGRHFADYLRDAFEREVENVPIYRGRDAKRGKNLERLASAAAVYIGGGIADQFLEVFHDSPAAEALQQRFVNGGMVVAIAAAAQTFGRLTRSLRGQDVLPGLCWLPKTAIETNFDPAHDRRLRQLLESPGVEQGLALSAGSSISFGPDGAVHVSGSVFTLASADGELQAIDG